MPPLPVVVADVMFTAPLAVASRLAPDMVPRVIGPWLSSVTLPPGRVSVGAFNPPSVTLRPKPEPNPPVETAEALSTPEPALSVKELRFCAPEMDVPPSAATVPSKLSWPRVGLPENATYAGAAMLEIFSKGLAIASGAAAEPVEVALFCVTICTEGAVSRPPAT